VGGTSHCLNFCHEAGVPLVFSSTILPLDGAPPTGYRQSKEAAEAVCANALQSHGVPSAVLQLGDIGTAHEPSATLPDDDYLVILLRACVALGLFPAAPWAISVMAVDQAAALLSEIALAGANRLLGAGADAFDGQAKETKGDLVPFSALHEWLGGTFQMEPCPLAQWTEAVEAAAKTGSAQLSKEGFQRLVMLLPSIDQEFSAEEERRQRGEGQLGELKVGAEWGAHFAAALRRELPTQQPPAC